MYRFRDGELEQVTRDHSTVQGLIDQGLLTHEEARVHPAANMITRAVGADMELELEIEQAPILPGDTFLLCTDGLTKVLSDGQIAASILPAEPQTTAQDLLRQALEKGASDNVSIVIAHFPTDFKKRDDWNR